MDRDTASLRFLIKPDYFLALALALLILPLKWVLAWIAASGFHELCHYLAIQMCGCKTFRIQISIKGVEMEAEFTDSIKELICALAGPVGGFLLILTGKWFPRFAICGFFQSIYNLIPIYPMDGGRAVHCILQYFVPAPYNEKLEKWIVDMTMLVFLLLGLYASFYLKIGIMPLFFAIVLILKNKQGKCTCKEVLFGVK